MKITTDRITYMHHRSSPCDATFAFLANHEGITFGWSIVSDKDQFNRAKGRLIASNRLMRAGIVIPADYKVDGETNPKAFLAPFEVSGEAGFVHGGFYVDRPSLTWAAFTRLCTEGRLPRTAYQRFMTQGLSFLHPYDLPRHYATHPYR